MATLRIALAFILMSFCALMAASCCGGSNEAQIRSTPYALTATDSEYMGRIALTWQYDSDYDSFEVWRKTPDSEWEAYAQVEGTSFDDTDVQPGVEYEYKVRACLNNSFSQHSYADKGTSDAGDTTITATLDIVSSNPGTGYLNFTSYAVYDILVVHPYHVYTDQSQFDFDTRNDYSFECPGGINILIPTAVGIEWDPAYSITNTKMGDRSELSASFVGGETDYFTDNLTILALESTSRNPSQSIIRNQAFTITSDDGQVITCTTQTNGVAFATLDNGKDYIVTPSSTNTTFTPASATVSALQEGESTALVFIAFHPF